MRLGIYLALCAAAASLGGCGGTGNGGGGTCNPGATASITIKNTGVSPTAVCVLPTGSVTFTNSDTVQHDLVSDGTCPELDTGIIAASASAMVTFPTAKVCAFHDTVNPSNTAFQGTVAVTTAPATGPGY
jgi:plastocyanin